MLIELSIAILHPNVCELTFQELLLVNLRSLCLYECLIDAFYLLLRRLRVRVG